MKSINAQAFNAFSAPRLRGLFGVTRIPNGVRMHGSSLPNNESLPMASRVAMSGYDGYDAIATGRANAAERRAANRARQIELANAKHQARLAKVAARMPVAKTTTATTSPVDYTQVTTMSTPIQPGVDASMFVAGNIPNLPAVTNAQIRREKKNLKKTEKAINQLNKLNAIRDKAGASLALGLNAPVDYSQVQAGYLPGVVGDPNAGMMTPQTGQPYPPMPYYPPQGYDPMAYQQPAPYYPPQQMPMMGGGQGGPIFSSQIMGEQQFDPYFQQSYQIEPAWQDTAPFNLPMTESGDLLFMQPNDDPLGWGDTAMSEQFAEYFDGDPLDSYLAFSADPAPQSGMTNFFTGLTTAVAGGVKSAADYNTSRYTAKTNLTNAQIAARNKPVAAKSSNMPLIIGGVVVVGVLALLMSRK